MADKEEQKQPQEEKPKAEKKAPEAAAQQASPQAKGKSKRQSHPLDSPTRRAVVVDGSRRRRKKISRMKLEEVEAEIKIVKEKMGGFQSGFARHLLARRKELAESSSLQGDR